MGGWFAIFLLTGLGAIGISSMLSPTPHSARVATSKAEVEAAVQSRIAFEYLVNQYTIENGSFVGVLYASDLKAAGVVSNSLASGSFAPSWRATVASGGAVTFCTPVNAKTQSALVSKGFTLGTIQC